jgi:transposase
MTDGSCLGDFDSHLATTMPRGGHPPHQIQALKRTQPLLPLGFGYVEGVTHDYVRHGTTTLFAALDLLDGTILAQCRPRHRHQEFLGFLRAIDQAVPPDLDLHVVLDNGACPRAGHRPDPWATHKHPKVKAWLARHPRWTFHFTPPSCSWLNAVETLFAKLAKRRLKRGVVPRSSTSRLPSTATSPSTTPIPSRSSGPNPPARSSPA